MSKNAYLTPSTVPTGLKMIRLYVPNGGGDWDDLVRGALCTLIDDWAWEQFGTMTVEDTVSWFVTAVSATLEWEDV